MKPFLLVLLFFICFARSEDSHKTDESKTSTPNVKSRLLSTELTSSSSTASTTNSSTTTPITKTSTNDSTTPTTTPFLPTLPPDWKCQLHNDYLCKILEKTLRMNLKKAMFQNMTLSGDVEVGNQTFKSGTEAEEEFFKYYTVKVVPPSEGKGYWVDFDSLKPGAVQTKQELVNSHRKASHVALTFDFPFYGLGRRSITITTGGFLFLGDQLHSWLAASQFVAPLMANFQTDKSNDSVIHFFDNGTTFTVEWRNVTLSDQPNLGPFSFQASLKETGDIVFSYGAIPAKISDISNASHPVKIGISDAYTINHDILYLRRKTIYEYHRVDVKEKHEEKVTNGSAIYFTAHKTCVSFTDCRSCLTANVSFDCMWCPEVSRCSDGFDRYRQEWHLHGCDKKFINSPENCTTAPTVPPTTTPAFGGGPFKTTTSTSTKESEEASSKRSTTTSSTMSEHDLSSTTTDRYLATTSSRDDGPYYPPKPRLPVIPKYRPTPSPTTGGGRTSRPEKVKAGREDEDGAASGAVVGTAGIVMSILVVFSVLSLGMWVVYAYKFPHSRSGQLLIRYRPTQWRMFRREVRYTATSLHM